MKIRNIIFVAALAVSSSTFATETAQTPWLIRARAIDVVPYPSSATLDLIGGTVDSISTQVVPELDFSYFFTSNISAELILATSHHSVAANHTVLEHVDLGSANVLPPTLTLQYHFLQDYKFRPYLGAGINYTYFYNIKHGSNPAVENISYENTFGPALQVGADYAINDHWLINVDVKKVYMTPDVDVTTVLGKISPTVHINPAIFGVGIGYRF
jgi:outer membrane protein